MFNDSVVKILYRYLQNIFQVSFVFRQHQITSLTHTLLSTVKQLTQTCELIGISIDLDVISPNDAPGVETPVEGGIRVEELINAISKIEITAKYVLLRLASLILKMMLTTKHCI